MPVHRPPGPPLRGPLGHAHAADFSRGPGYGSGVADRSGERGQVSCRTPKQRLHSIPRQRDSPEGRCAGQRGPQGALPITSPLPLPAGLAGGPSVPGSPDFTSAVSGKETGETVTPSHLGSWPQFLQHCVPQEYDVQLSPTVLYRRARGWSWDLGVVRVFLELLCVTAGTHDPASWPEGQAVRPPLGGPTAKPGPHPTS